MAQIPLVNGGSQPVFAIDTLNGPQLAANTAYTPTNTPVMIMGPKLDFFQLAQGNTAGTGNISNQAGVNGAIQQIIQSIQQTATVAFYQAGNTQLSIAVYPTGAYTASTLQAQVAALGNIQVSASGTVTGFYAGNVTATNVGFTLSATAV